MKRQIYTAMKQHRQEITQINNKGFVRVLVGAKMENWKCN